MDNEKQIYALQTFTGNEDQLREFIRKLLSSVEDSDIYIPKREVKKRYKGQWVRKMEILFPGYIFVESADPKTLFHDLKKVPQMSVILHMGDKRSEYQFVELKPKEQEFLRRLCGNKAHTLGISRVQIVNNGGSDTIPYHEGQYVRIMDGPLASLMGYIVGFDIHKRKAKVKTDMFGGSVVHVGIDLIKEEDAPEDNGDDE